MSPPDPTDAARAENLANNAKESPEFFLKNFEKFLELLDHEDATVREHAISPFSKLVFVIKPSQLREVTMEYSGLSSPLNQLISQLIHLLEDESSTVQATAVMALSTITESPEFRRDTGGEMSSAGGTESARNTVADNHSDFGDIRSKVRDAIPLIIDHLHHPDRTVRARSARAIRRFHYNWPGELEPAIPPLLELVEEGSPEVRENAIRSLSILFQTYPTDVRPAIEFLVDDFHDLDIDVMDAAVGMFATAAFTYPSTIKPITPQLISLLDDTDSAIRGRAAESLAGIATTYPSSVEQATSSLIDLLSKSENGQDTSACKALTYIARESPERVAPAAPKFVRLLETADEYSDEKRRYASFAVGLVGTEEQLEPLQGLLNKEEDYGVAMAMRGAIKRISIREGNETEPDQSPNNRELRLNDIHRELNEAKITRWRSAKNNHVYECQELVVITDEANTRHHIPVPVDGTLTETCVSEGEEVNHETVIARFNPDKDPGSGAFLLGFHTNASDSDSGDGVEQSSQGPDLASHSEDSGYVGSSGVSSGDSDGLVDESNSEVNSRTAQTTTDDDSRVLSVSVLQDEMGGSSTSHLNVDNIAYLKISNGELTTTGYLMIFGSAILVGLLLSRWGEALGFLGFVATAYVAYMTLMVDSEVEIGTTANRHVIDVNDPSHTDLESEFVKLQDEYLKFDDEEKFIHLTQNYRYYFVPDNIVSIGEPEGSLLHSVLGMSLLISVIAALYSLVKFNLVNVVVLLVLAVIILVAIVFLNLHSTLQVTTAGNIEKKFELSKSDADELLRKYKMR